MNYFVGIDVSKETLDVAIIHQGNLILESKLNNQAKSIRSFFRKCIKEWKTSAEQFVVCLEHTGMYNNILLKTLVDLNSKICVEPAIQIQKSQGIVRGKSDKSDARRIAQYTYKNREELRFWVPARPVLQRIQVLLSFRARLIKIKKQLEVPVRELVQFTDPAIVRSLALLSKGPIKIITQNIKKIEQEINTLVQGDDLVKNQCIRATSIPGIGKITALSMIIASGSFKKISEAKQFACYAGVAPFKNESGTSIRGRSQVSRMANMAMKRLLHMAALSAIQCNSDLRTFYERKVIAGKNKMSVLNAVRNKLISRVYACVKQEKMYEKIYQHTVG